MYKTIGWLVAILCFSFSYTWAQKTYTLSGYVRDANTGEELIGVNLVLPDLNIGTTTNAYGYYALSVPAGQQELSVQYIGYQTFTKKLALKADVTLNVELKPSTEQLEAVEVTASKLDQNVSSVEMSVAKLSVKEVKKIPQLLGEADIIRSLTLLPGISTLGEGSSGFNVRGGNTDQNLILLDEAPVYNSSHLFGFFSIFNADAVKDVKVYKGGIPANYGGRLSSVVDVKQIDGNNREFAAQGGIGLLSSRLLVEGPLKKEKASFMVAGRRSYADIFLGLAEDPAISQNILYFYDLNTKVNWNINKNNRLFLSGYFGRDVFGIEEFFDFDWGNATGSLRWNHLFSPKTFANFSLVFSDYTYSLGTPEEDEFNFRLTSTIQDYHFKAQFNYYPNDKNQIDYGVEGIYYRFRPGTIAISLQEDDLVLQEEFAIEPSAYISHQIKFSPLFTLQYGLRYSSFYNIGPRTVNEYSNPSLPTAEDSIGATVYQSGDLIEAYTGLAGLEPRLSANYRLNDEQSIKASYNRTRQYIHLITNTTAPTPVDLYRPAGKYIQPATVNQVAAGYFRNFAQNTYETSLEGYYKTFNNVVDYRNGADLIFNQSIETELLSGIGRSYGLEFLVRKNKGRFTGWVAYTWSKTENKVEGVDPTVAINAGEWYPANFDKRHDVSIVLNYKFNAKWDLSSSWVFQTGRPITPPEGRFIFEDFTAPIYRKRNSYRIPNYHRLDISANYSPKKDTTRYFYSSWSFGVYNAYARRNPYSIFFEQQEGTAANPNNFATQAVQLSIFATAIPFVTWNFNF
jgi:hypothetical protein